MHAPDCKRPDPERLLFLHQVGAPPGDPRHEIGYDEDVVEICPSSALIGIW